MKQLLWTIQHEAAWEAFEKTGVLTANEDHLFCQDDFRFAYDWISQQMIQKIGAPPDGVHYPVWAWYQWEGKRMRQDLRQAGYAKQGTPMVQITFEAEEAEFLQSDFDSWHCVLNDSYLANSVAELENFYNQFPQPTRNEVKPSWQRIFDLTSYEQNWDCPHSSNIVANQNGTDQKSGAFCCKIVRKNPCSNRESTNFSFHADEAKLKIEQSASSLSAAAEKAKP